MKKSRFTEQQIINILKQADAGVKVQDRARLPYQRAQRVILGDY
jgi:hypothetical protein